MEDMMLELVKICQEKEFLCIHDDIDDLIESALTSKLLLINSNSQHLDKKEQEVKNVVEQSASRGNLYNDDFEDIEYVEAPLSDPENVSIEEENNVEEENVVQQEEEEEFPPMIEVFLCWIYVLVSKIFTSSEFEVSLGKSISFDLYCLA
nr:hypothetical protein [Tanacetum cinerariifolium]